MLTLDQALALLAESGINVTREQLLALLHGNAINGATHDSENDEWHIPAAEITAYAKFRKRKTRRNWFAAAGAFVLAASTGVAAIAGNLSNITKLTCEYMRFGCPPKPPKSPVFEARMVLEEQTCPMAYIVPDEHKKRVAGMVGKPQLEIVSALLEEMKTNKWTMTGILNVEIYVSGKNIEGHRPILPSRFQYIVKRLSDGPTEIMAVVSDGCGGGLETLTFEAGELLRSTHTYIDEVKLVKSSGGEVYKRLTLEPGEVLYYNSGLICKEDGIYQVSVKFPYTLDGSESEISSPPINILCPGKIHMIGEDTDDLIDLGVGLLQDSGFYRAVAEIEASSAPIPPRAFPMRIPKPKLPPTAGPGLPEQTNPP